MADKNKRTPKKSGGEDISPSDEEQTSWKIYVSHFPSDTVEKDFHLLFLGIDRILSMNVDRSFAFITFKTEEHYEQALSRRGLSIRNHSLTVRRAFDGCAICKKKDHFTKDCCHKQGNMPMRYADSESRYDKYESKNEDPSQTSVDSSATAPVPDGTTTSLIRVHSDILFKSIESGLITFLFIYENFFTIETCPMFRFEHASYRNVSMPRSLPVTFNDVRLNQDDVIVFKLVKFCRDFMIYYRDSSIKDGDKTVLCSQLLVIMSHLIHHAVLTFLTNKVDIMDCLERFIPKNYSKRILKFETILKIPDIFVNHFIKYDECWFEEKLSLSSMVELNFNNVSVNYLYHLYQGLISYYNARLKTREHIKYSYIMKGETADEEIGRVADEEIEGADKVRERGISLFS